MELLMGLLQNPNGHERPTKNGNKTEYQKRLMRWRSRPCLERLEDRTLLTVFTDLANSVGGPNGLVAAQTVLNNALDTASKLPLLTSAGKGVLGTDLNEIHVVTTDTVNAIQNTLNAGANDTNAQMASALATALGLSSTDVHVTNPSGNAVEVELHFHRDKSVGTPLPANLNLNLGLPGLPINIGATTNGSITTTVGFDFAFGFGYDGSKLYVNPNSKVSDFGSSLPAHQLVLQATIGLSDNFQASATVGLLQAIVDNRSKDTNLTGTFTMDSGLGLTGSPKIDFSGSLKLNLHAAASFNATTDNGNSGATFVFPGIATDLHFNWDLPTGKPQFSYDNVSFELGSFLSNFVGPIIQDIQIFTQPLAPLLAVLNFPLPGLTDLSHLIGKGNVTLLAIAKEAAEVGAFGPGIDEAVELAATLLKITDDINQIEVAVGGKDVSVPLGSFSLDTTDSTVVDSLVNGDVNFDDLKTLGADLAPKLLGAIKSTGAISSIEDAASKIDAAAQSVGIASDTAGQIADKIKQLGNTANNGFHLNFPIIDNPASVIFPMLLGSDGDFASFDANFDFAANIKDIPTGYTIYGLSINASGSVHVQANIHVGYDTYGIREFFRDGATKPADLLDGFYLADPKADQPQFGIAGNFALSAGVSAGLFSVAVGGGVYTGDDPDHPTDHPVIVGFHDPDSATDDGKLRLSKIGADNGWIFDATGKLKAGLGIVVKVGVEGPFGVFIGYQKTFNIQTVTLLDLDALQHLTRQGIPSQKQPILGGNGATGDPTVDADGVLTLFLGSNVSKRKNVLDTTDDNPEQWTVTHEAGDPADTVTIKAFGLSQKVAGVKKIVANGVTAALNITIADGVTADADLEGGNGDDQLTYEGTGSATVAGGGGNDRLTIGPGAKDSELHGGAGNDILIGGSASDKLYGEAGDDVLFAGAGDQLLDGGDNDDQLTAGSGHDALVGGAGNDLISWHTGNGMPTSIDGGSGVGESNTLEVLGDNSVDTFTAGKSSGALTVSANGIVLSPTGVQILSLDGQAGADSITVNDLKGTSIKEVHVNYSQSTAADNAADATTIDARAGNSLLIDEFVSKVDGSGTMGAKMLLNGLDYKVFVADTEAADIVTLTTASSATTVTVDPLYVDPSSNVPQSAAIPLPGQLVVNDGPAANVFNVKSTTGTTTINAHGGNNVFNVGSLAPATGGVLAGIQAALILNGSGGADAATFDDAGDTTGQSGTLSNSQLTGLGMGSQGITYSALSAVTVGLGTKNDNFTITSTSSPITVTGGQGNDTITLQPTSLGGSVYLDGGEDSDSYVDDIIGTGSSLVNVHDTGATGTDLLTVNGTSAADNFLLRASQNAYPTGVAFVAALHGTPVSDVERVNYDKSLEKLELDMGAGDDTATLDDNWAATTVSGGTGNDHFQIGQIFKSPRDALAGVASQDVFQTTQTTRGYLSNGVSFATTIHGDDGNDDFTVFHNSAVLNLDGDNGDDTFSVRAFATEGSTDTNVNGGADADLIQYVVNAPLNIDGGDGTDTLRVIGTEFADKFIITKDGIFGGGLTVSYVNIENLIVDGAEGDDEFYVLSTGVGVDVTLEGDLGNDKFSIAGDTPDVVSGANDRPAAVQSHRVNPVQGPLHINGGGGEGSAGGLGTPVMLPGETNKLTSDGSVLAYSGTGTSLSVDSLTVSTADLLAALPNQPAPNATLNDLVGKTIEISDGPGENRFWLITGVNAGPNTTVLTLESPGIPAPEWGLPNATSKYAITHLSPNFFVSEATTLDSLTVFNDGTTSGNVGGLSATLISGLGMGASGITYANLETLEILLGTGNDAFTVTGTASGAITAVHGGGGDDHLTITGGGGAAAPLLVYGDTTQDRSRYTSNGTGSMPTVGFAFATDGNDTIDASADTQSVAIYGGGGNDSIYGGSAGDQLAGGAGNDEIHGGAGDDHIYGDSGFNQDLSTRLDFVTAKGVQILQVATSETTGNDRLYGDAGNDILFGDHGVISQTPGSQRLFTTGNVTQITTVNVANGGNDEIHGGAGNDIIMGGAGADLIFGDDGNDILMGDHGLLTYVTNVGDLSLPDLIQSTALGIGSQDSVYGNAGNDIIIGGPGGDMLFGGNGVGNAAITGNDADIILGDNAELDQVTSRAPEQIATIKTTDTSNSTGGDDIIQGNEDDDVEIGGVGNDRIDGNQGRDLILGDNGVLTSRPGGVKSSPRFRTLSGTQLYDAAGNPLVNTAWQNDPAGAPQWANWQITLDDGSTGLFGNDYLAGGQGNDTIFGQAGNDTIQGDGSIQLDVGTLNNVKSSVEDFDHIDSRSGLPVSASGNDGDDYVEGGPGNDLLFGNLGQDDLIGGSSSLFGLGLPAERGDGSDTIFGGAGTRTARNDPGDGSSAGHARDADTILGDNGNIFRVLGAGGSNLTFNFDTYGSLKIIPRAVGLLDYTPGGSSSDLGGADLIHGEAGDDEIHGETGNDVLFGEGQDDNLYGEAGNDRIYGGTGEDGILGDDGRLALSRDGLTEPLFGIATANAQVDITLPGPFTGAWIYITGRIDKQAHLIAPTMGGNDLIFGGTGDDFIHGGAGDDAISGAEAQAAWYNDLPVAAAFYAHGGYTVNFNGTSVDPANPLGYDATTRKLAAYDANNPLTKISNFFLNFDATDGSGNKIDDGKDRVFGDDGNDWLVGGTDNDRLFGGKGDDLINADDNLETNGGLNNQPDAAQFADRDFVYGGDGLDVMIANTGGDRMFDWSGEFNSYLVPFSAFGEPTVYRSPNPHIQAFLLALGQESGADPTMTEPNGELGLFTQQDPQWQANRGAPRDPQAGNTPGTHRDTQGGPEDDRNTALPLILDPSMAPSGASSLTSNSTDVTVSQVFVSSDPSNPTQLALFVGGTNNADSILIQLGRTSAFLYVVINGKDRGQFIINSSVGSIDRVIVYGNDGNDSITVSPNVTIDAVLFGGAGNDVLTAGGGSSFLDGGDGNDVLTGGAGRSVQIGGLGQDSLSGGKNDDLLIGGTYRQSGDLDSVFSLMAIWNSSESYAQRITDLRTGGADGLFAFNTTTVLDDAAVDYLYGNQGQDWFWVFGSDKTDVTGSEINK
jgi:Ca2+-binding RTX toxin-like protein